MYIKSNIFIRTKSHDEYKTMTAFQNGKRNVLQGSVIRSQT